MLERGEKSRADLHADGKDEEYQAELLYEMPYFVVDRHAEMAQHDAHEEYPRDSERHSADFDFPQQDADGDDQREGQHGMGDAATEKQGI